MAVKTELVNEFRICKHDPLLKSWSVFEILDYHLRNIENERNSLRWFFREETENFYTFHSCKYNPEFIEQRLKVLIPYCRETKINFVIGYPEFDYLATLKQQT